MEVLFLKSTNASATAFGWDFQSNAAIMLMLKNIEKATRVKVEGETEDVEITFSDGKMLMSQAKSVVKADDLSNVRSNLKKGLDTLNNASKLNDVEQLVFITNSPNPFNDADSKFHFSSPLNIVAYSDLHNNAQQIITDICSKNGYDFDKEMLSICVMQFHTEDLNERHKVLFDLTTQFLNSLGRHRIATNEILTLWQHSFAVNATQRSTSITKKRMMWPIIAILCDVSAEDGELQDYDENDVEEIIHKYKSIINNNSERFEFISRVLSDYNEYGTGMKSKERTEKFIAEKWDNYENDFDLKSADDTTREMVIRLTVANVLRSQNVIKQIKGKVKL